MKNFYTLLFLSFAFAFIPNQIEAQPNLVLLNPCGNGSDNPPGCLMCGPIFVGSTEGFTPDTFSYDFPCGSIENSQWISILSSSTNISAIIVASECLNDDGVELAIYDKDLNLVGNCFSPQNWNDPGNISASGLNYGEIYYIMVDGKNGDFCDFTLTVTGGISDPPGGAPQGIQSNPDRTTFCVGSEVTYSLKINGLATHIQWEIPPNGEIISGAGTDEIVVRWNAAGSNEISSFGRNACFPGPIFIRTDTILEISPTILGPLPACIEEPETEERIFTTELGCDSIVRINYIPADPVLEVDTTICEGEKLIYNSQEFSTAGNYSITIPEGSKFGCDSIINLNISVNPIQSIIQKDVEFDCQGDSILLFGDSSTSGMQYFYLWSTENGNILGGQTQAVAEINAPGKYYLETFLEDGNGNKICSVSDSVLVGESQANPPNWITHPNITCINESLDFEVPYRTSYLDYNWTTNKEVEFDTIGSKARIIFKEEGFTEVCVQILDTCGWTTPLCETVEVLRRPDTYFEAPASEVCLNDSLHFEYNGNAGSNAFIQWTVVGPFLFEQFTNTRSLDYPFEVAGNYEIRLAVIENSCIGVNTVQNVRVLNPLPNPELSFESNYKEIKVRWDAVPDALNYDVYVDNQLVSANQFNRNYLLENRNTGDTVDIRVVANAELACRNSESTITAFTPVCDNAPFILQDIFACKGRGIRPLISYFGCNWQGQGVVTGECSFDPQLVGPGEYTIRNPFMYDQCIDTLIQTVKVGESFTYSTSIQQPVFLGSTGSIQIEIDTPRGNENILWNFGSTSAEVTDLEPGNYCAELSRGVECRWTECFTILPSEYSLPNFILTCPRRDKQIGVKPSTGISLEWTPAAGLSCTDCNDPVVNVQTSSIYSVFGTTDDGRRDTTTLYVLVLPEILCGFFKEEMTYNEMETLLGQEISSLSLEEIQNKTESKIQELVEEQVLVFPNPAKNTVNFTSNFEVESIQVFNQIGQLLKTFYKNTKEGVLEIENLPVGSYYLRFTAEGLTSTKRIIIQ
ncbi:MAG: T9SS type A sorting domain-containing protein [Saprospiraceae bacterium]